MLYRFLPNPFKDEFGKATDKKYVQFIKIEATMEFLYKYAEILNVNMPLRSDLVSVINDIKRIKMEKYELDEKAEEIEGEDLETLLEEEEDEVADLIEEVSTGSCLEGLKSMLKPMNFKIADEVDYFSAIFRKDKLDFFDIYSEGKWSKYTTSKFINYNW